jgi:hypothetical protein
MLNLGSQMVAFEWEPNILPEMLWLASLMVENWPDRGEHHAALDALDEFVPTDGPCLDGTIAAFSLLPEEHRAEARSRFAAADGLNPDFANALAHYPDCPARWLLDDWLTTNTPDPEAAERYLKELVLRMRDGRTSYATQLRAIALYRMAKNGKLAISPQVKSLLLLKNYPRDLTDEEKELCEGGVRAFLVGCLGRPQHPATQTEWAAHFWRRNWKLSDCEHETPFLTEDDEPDETLRESNAPAVLVSQLRDGFLAAVEQLERDLQTLQGQAEPDLFSPVTDEVRMGLASRQTRLLRRLVEDPNVWTHERAPHHVRSMIDARIVAAWLVLKNDPALYQRYKEYGQGKLKLLKLNFEQHLEEQGGFGETSQEYLDYLEAQLNEERSEEFQAISLKANFADRSIRLMAEDVGLKNLYDLNYSPLSGESHGDWGSLVTHDLERCSNPLHRYHRLGRFAGRDEELSLDYLFHAVNLMADTVEGVFDSYRLSATVALDRFREGFSKALDAAADEVKAGATDGTVAIEQPSVAEDMADEDKPDEAVEGSDG